ncbi:MAG TPA: hypothetical protein VFB14_14640 [Bryobacteraceae bacterium]|jgi:hypothetical protein|nr:hypothetical protein [Bryobacteraceae bacterium]
MADLNAFWTWSGRYVGFRSSDCLFGPDGRQVGYFAEGDEIYASTGEYVGEIRGGNRLITNLSKKAWTRRGFVPRFLKPSPGRASVNPKEMLTGFEDFRMQPRVSNSDERKEDYGI